MKAKVVWFTISLALLGGLAGCGGPSRGEESGKTAPTARADSQVISADEDATPAMKTQQEKNHATGGSGAGSISTGFAYDAYAGILKAYVDDRGMVNYTALKANRDGLDSFVHSLGTLNRATYDAWSDDAKIAFWINAYNALTITAIIDHYPIKSSFFTSLAYPKNSIRQISGVWDELKFDVLGDSMTLDHIEHEILRKQFHEPRIHMALVCAAMGCPPLRNEPYAGNTLDEQLKDQTHRFLSNPKKFHIDRQKGVVYLSPIFKWFGEDFIAKYGTETGFGDHSAKERAVLAFVAGHLPAEDADYLRAGDYDVEFLDYDWSLNEQPGSQVK